MERPELYNQYNLMPRQGTIHVLQKYGSRIKWRDSDDSAMDIGCGDGSVTVDILKKYVPNSVKLFASDISEKMINYAKERYAKEGVVFTVLNAEGDLTDDLRSGFNHVFSFYAIQFVRNQEKAFQNIYDLLMPGGDCLLAFLRYMPVYDMFIEAARDPKWSSTWIKDVNKFVSPYNYIEDSENKITDILQNIGFINIEVKCEKMLHIMKNGMEYKHFMKSVQPFNMTDEVFEEFASYSIPVAHKIGILQKTETMFEDRHRPIEFNYELMVVYATKS